MLEARIDLTCSKLLLNMLIIWWLITD
jgi:hypothetical protein